MWKTCELHQSIPSGRGVQVHFRDMDQPVPKVGLCFRNVHVLRMALRQYAIWISFDVKYLKNDRTRVTATFAENLCKYCLNYPMLPDGWMFERRRQHDEHTYGYICVEMLCVESGHCRFSKIRGKAMPYKMFHTVVKNLYLVPLFFFFEIMIFVFGAAVDS